MARETKIGLLVGMGFIVCFAIILSHRGQIVDPQAGEFEIAAVLSDVPSTDDFAAHRRAAEVGRTAIASHPPRHRPIEAHEPVAQNPAETARDPEVIEAREPDRRPANTLREPPPGAEGPIRTAVAQAESARDRFTRRRPPIESSQSPEPPSADDSRSSVLQASPPAEEADRPAPDSILPRRRSIDLSTPEAVLAAVEAGPMEQGVRETVGAETGEASAVLPETATRPEPVRGEVYRVQPGDSLTRIVREHYGSASGELIRKVYEANRDRMSSPDQLVAGHEIILPDIARQTETMVAEARVAPAAPVADERASAAAPVAAHEPSVTYEIESGDTLAKIARRHYGTDSREVVDAIVRANARIDDPNRISVGQSIVLPDLVIAGTRSPVQLATSDEPRQERPAPAQQTQTAAARPKKDDPRWEWYELKKGDVYTTVAADRLGTAKRWRELVELNKDIFPNPDRIRHGVKIRVPVGLEDATSRGLSTRSAG